LTINWKIIGIFLLIITPCVVMYAQVGDFGTVLYDDQQLMDYLDTHESSAIAFLWQGVTENPEPCYYYAPFAWLSYLFTTYLAGNNIGAHHLVNLFFHICAALVLFAVLVTATGCPWRSFFVGVLFGIHPLNVETVVMLCGRYSPLSALFCLLSLAAYVRYARTGHRARYWLCFLFYGMGILTKLTASYFFIAFMLVDFWPLRRMSSTSSSGPEVSEAVARSVRSPGNVSRVGLTVEKIPFMAAGLMAVFFSWYLFSNPIEKASFSPSFILVRLLNLSVIISNFVFRTFFPIYRNIITDHLLLPAWQIVGGGLLLAGLTILAFKTAKRHPYILTGWLWFLCLIVPHLLIRSGDMVDRSTYLPVIGLLTAAVWGVGALVERYRIKKSVLSLAAAAMLLCLVFYGRYYTGYWKNFETVDQYVQEHHLPLDNEILWNFVNRLHENGRYGKALAYFEEILKKDAENAKYNYMAGVLSAENKAYGSALAYYSKAISLDPDFVPAYVNKAALLAGMGDREMAVRLYQKALQLDPNLNQVHYNIAMLFSRAGETEAAIVHLRKALRINPGDKEARQQLKKLVNKRKEQFMAAP